MVNPTHSFDPEDNAFQDGRYLRVGLHEQADGTFSNASPSTPLPTALDLEAAVRIPRGDVTGVTSINKFGHNPDVDTATIPETLWDGPTPLWVPPTAARIHVVVSTSAQDTGTLVSSGTVTTTGTTTLIDSSATFVTDSVDVGDSVLNTTNHSEHSYVVSVDSETQLTLEELHHGSAFNSGETYSIVAPGGTGAAFAHIKNGIDGTKGFAQEFVILKGLTGVNTANPFFRINRAHVGLCGTAGSNVGVITFTAATNSTVTATIRANEGQTLMAVYTVPKGYEAFVSAAWCQITRDATKAATATVTLRSSPYSMGGDFGKRVEGVFGLNTAGAGVDRRYSPYRKIEAQADIYLQVDAVSDNDLEVSGGFDIILVADTV